MGNFKMKIIFIFTSILLATYSFPTTKIRTSKETEDVAKVEQSMVQGSEEDSHEIIHQDITVEAVSKSRSKRDDDDDNDDDDVDKRFWEWYDKKLQEMRQHLRKVSMEGVRCAGCPVTAWDTRLVTSQDKHDDVDISMEDISVSKCLNAFTC